MNSNEERHRALKRLLANGPLTAMPTRPSDQQLLALLAAARFSPDRTYREADVNETLGDWIGTFCEPHAIDHVTLRRMLVDARLLSRTTSGSVYSVNRERLPEFEAAATIEPAAVLAEVRREREARKRARAA
ncbi:MAG TPA: DUF2087 domain-containing protein [Usitatibacter sp.]|nr:DUF2087 domain-containing protein [Usitatibacter sp.]